MTVLQAVATEEECRAVLGVAFPGLVIDSLGYLAEGWDSTVFDVNGTHVFRFPKRAAVDAMLRKEMRLLPEIVPALPTPIPTFDYIAAPSSRYAWHIVGYHKLAGTSATERVWTADAVAVIAPELASFLQALHTFPTGRAIALGAPSFTPRSWMDQYVALYARARDAAKPRLAADVFARFVSGWEEMLSDGSGFDFEAVLIHGDLAMEHVLVDAVGHLRGVIDFGDAMVADPALDFAGFPDELGRRVLLLYSTDPSTRDGIWRRRELYRRAGPLHAIAAGVELGRDDLLRSGIDGLRRLHG